LYPFPIICSATLALVASFTHLQYKTMVLFFGYLSIQESSL
jgi:hypothetical protein